MSGRGGHQGGAGEKSGWLVSLPLARMVCMTFTSVIEAAASRAHVFFVRSVGSRSAAASAFAGGVDGLGECAIFAIRLAVNTVILWWMEGSWLSARRFKTLAHLGAERINLRD